MKKLIAAIVITSIGAAFADPYYVYDYKASIKRLEISAKYNKKDGVTQKYSVKSDSIIGFVTLPICIECGVEEGIATSLGIKDDGYAYLTLKSNSKLVKDADYAVLKTPVKASIGVFGAEQYMDHEIVDEKKATQAWMALDFPVLKEQFDTALLVAKKDVSAGVPLGFYGLTNTGENEDRIDIQNTGFGTAKVQKSTTFDFCYGPKSTQCLSVATISGTLVGYPTYLAACDATPIWDLCDVSEAGEINQAVISGTWSLKFNKKLTDDSNDSNGVFTEDYILAKLGAKGYVVIDAEGAKASN